MNLAPEGLNKTQILQKLNAFRKDDVNYKDGKLFSYVYYPGEEGEDILKTAYAEFITENGIDPTAFPSLKKMENEVIGFCKNLLKADHSAVGHLTTGGTESLLLAVKIARDRAKDLHPEITEPEIILPYTVHSSFFKACAYFNVKPVVVPVRDDYRADAAAIEAAITKNTVMIAASAPSYAYGVVDPISAIGAIALKHNLPFHVDGCIGAFFLSYMERAGLKVPEFSFSVPGVTSISMDLHKYAYAGKGCSVLLLRDESFRKYQYFVCPEWTGYTIINPTILSSKTGGPIAGAWAMLNYFGEKGYQRLALQTMQCTEILKKEISSMDGLRIVGAPDMSLISFVSDKYNIYSINDELNKLGWKVQFQLASDVAPANIHLTISKPHIGKEAEFIRDLKIAIQKSEETRLPDVKQILNEELSKGLNAENINKVLGRLGAAEGNLPENMASVNQMLELLPNQVVKELLFNFVSNLYKSTPQ